MKGDAIYDTRGRKMENYFVSLLKQNILKMLVVFNKFSDY